MNSKPNVSSKKPVKKSKNTQLSGSKTKRLISKTVKKKAKDKIIVVSLELRSFLDDSLIFIINNANDEIKRKISLMQSSRDNTISEETARLSFGMREWFLTSPDKLVRNATDRLQASIRKFQTLAAKIGKASGQNYKKETAKHRPVKKLNADSAFTDAFRHLKEIVRLAQRGDTVLPIEYIQWFMICPVKKVPRTNLKQVLRWNHDAQFLNRALDNINKPHEKVDEVSLGWYEICPCTRISSIATILRKKYDTQSHKISEDQDLLLNKGNSLRDLR